MKLLFISQLFDPEYSIKGLSFLQGINKSGFDIDVITTFPNYPTGKIYPGYKKKLWQVENHDGVRIIRVYSYISHSRSKLSRALSYLTFMFFALFASLFIKRADVIYAYHPQLTTGLVAWIVKCFKKTPYITDVQDLWPDALIATGLAKKGILYQFINSFCQFIYSKSDHVIVLSKGYRDALIKRGVPANKISFIYNWSSDSSLVNNPVNVLSFLDKYESKFMYAGNLGSAQNLKSIIAAFSNIKDNSACLVLVGSGVEEVMLKKYSESLDVKNIYFIGYVSSGEIKQYLQAADVLVVHLKNEDLFKITIPSKVQSSLSVGKPILMAVGGEANEIVEEAGAGICALPEDEESLLAAIKEMLSRREEWGEMGARGKSFYNDNMSQELAVEKISLLLSKL